MIKITVAGLMCSYNGRSRGFLEQALLSVKNQTRPLDEFVFVDDGSNDNTAELVASIIPSAKIIRITNGGLPRARNLGIAQISSDLIALLDDDDLWAGGRIEQTVAPYQSDPSLLATTIIFSSSKIFLGKNPNRGHYLESLDCYGSWPACLVGPVIDGNGGVMLPLIVSKAVGPFREDLRHGEDLDMWHRALINGFKIIQIKSPLFFYRKSHASMSTGKEHDRRRFNFIQGQLGYDTRLNEEPILFCLSFAAFIRAILGVRFAESFYFMRMSKKFFCSASPAVICYRTLSIVSGFSRSLKNYFRSCECRVVSAAALKQVN